MAARVATATATASEGMRSPSREGREGCCSLYHRAVELVGKRWTGAILSVLMDGPLRFSEIGQLVPDLSDRLLSERLKELETEGIVERHVIDETPVRVEYALTDKGRALEPAVRGVGRMFCDIVTPSREPYEGDPRHVLRKVLQRAESMGFDQFYVGPELEFFYFRNARPEGGQPEILDEGGY